MAVADSTRREISEQRGQVEGRAHAAMGRDSVKPPQARHSYS
jgi:hypothetical protein